MAISQEMVKIPLTLPKKIKITKLRLQPALPRTNVLTRITLVPHLCTSECIFFNENVWILIKISLKFVPKSNQQYSSIDSDNGLSSIQRQAIICTNAGILLTWPLGTNVSEILILIYKPFHLQNLFGNVICEMAAILFRGRWANSRTHTWQHCSELHSSMHSQTGRPPLNWLEKVITLSQILACDWNSDFCFQSSCGSWCYLQIKTQFFI